MIQPAKYLSFPEIQKILSSHIQGLDALRGIAILWVVWHNSLAGFETSGVFSKVLALFTNTGWVGVQLFFVISGFLITGILVDGKKRDFILRNFYMRRFLRIFPLYYLFLFIFFVILPLVGTLSPEIADFKKMEILYWTYTENWAAASGGIDGLSHFWSLAVEEQFYIIWPLLVLKLNYRALLITCLIFIAIAIISRSSMAYLFPDIYEKINYQFTTARIDALSIGAVLALLVRNENHYLWLRQKAFSILIITLSLVLLILMINKNLSPVATGIGQLNQTVMAIVSAMCIYYLLHPATLLTRWWKHFTSLRWLNKIGKYSYAIYIFHMPMIKLLQNNYFIMPDDNDGLFWFLALLYNFASVFILSCLLALISWHVIEHPFLNLKKYFPMSIGRN